jgi:chromosome partitioning protein
MKTILIANQKGGCGKTMTAITLPLRSQKGYKVAFADADNQKSSLQWLKQRPDSVTNIQSLDWRHEKSIGEAPKHLDYLLLMRLAHCQVSMLNNWSAKSTCDCDHYNPHFRY